MTDETNNVDGPNPDLETVSKDMLGSFKDSLGSHWLEIRPDMEKHIQGVRESIVYIGELQATGELSEEAARELIEFQKLHLEAVLIEFSGMKDLAIEAAVNAAFKKVREAVNRLVNFELL